MIHFTWVVFGVIILLFIIGMYISNKDTGRDYAIDIISPILFILMIAFILIWGGIFWW